MIDFLEYTKENKRIVLDTVRYYLDKASKKKNVQFVNHSKQFVSGNYNEKYKTYSHYYINMGCGFDCETTNLYNSAYPYIWQLSLTPGFVLYSRFPELITDILAYISEYLKNSKYKHSRLLIWVANLGYEWQFFKHYFAELGITRVFAKEKRNPLQIIVSDNIEFRECIGLMGSSLANIAQTWTKTQKAVSDLDYTITRNSFTPMSDTELNYCFSDVIILAEMWQAVKKLYNNKSLPYTQTGAIRNELYDSMATPERKHANITAILHTPATFDNYTEMMKKLYSGGYCHTNALYNSIPVSNVKAYDLTSDYPAILLQRFFPVGKCEYLPHYNCIENSENYKHWFCTAVFFGIKAKTTHTLISKNKLLKYQNIVVDNGRIYSAEKIALYITEIDYNNICKLYTFERVQFVDVQAFRLSAPAPRYITDLVKKYYRLKQEIKESGEHKTTRKTEYIIAKQKLNGIYGMCATNIHLDEITFNENTVTLENAEELNPEKYTEQRNALFLSPMIAIYTTCYAREIIVNMICSCPELIVQYDTDSIYFLAGKKDSYKIENEVKRHNAECERMNAPHGEIYADLGEWALDGEYKKFKGLGSKRYIGITPDNHYHVVCAGVSEKAYLVYCKEKNANPFDSFSDGFTLPLEFSRKLASVYIDEETETAIVDDFGNYQKVKIPSCVVLREIPFMACLAAEYRKFLTDRFMDNAEIRKHII